MAGTKNRETDTTSFWQEHSEPFLIMAFDATRCGKIDNPDGYGKRAGICGDTVEFFVTITNRTITAVTFDLQGCLHTSACANTVAMLAEGKTVDQAWNITPELVIAYLQTLPRDHYHCAELAAGAFYLALSDYQNARANPPQPNRSRAASSRN